MGISTDADFRTAMGAIDDGIASLEVDAARLRQELDEVEHRLGVARNLHEQLSRLIRTSANGARTAVDDSGPSHEGATQVAVDAGETADRVSGVPSRPLSEQELRLVQRKHATLPKARADCVKPMLDHPEKVVWTTDELLTALGLSAADRIRVRTHLKRLEHAGFLGATHGRGGAPNQWWLAPPEGRDR